MYGNGFFFRVTEIRCISNNCSTPPPPLKLARPRFCVRLQQSDFKVPAGTTLYLMKFNAKTFRTPFKRSGNRETVQFERVWRASFASAPSVQAKSPWKRKRLRDNGAETEERKGGRPDSGPARRHCGRPSTAALATFCQVRGGRYPINHGAESGPGTGPSAPAPVPSAAFHSSVAGAVGTTSRQ